MSDPRITFPDTAPDALFTGQVKLSSTGLYDNKGLRKGIQTELLFGQTFTVHRQSRLWLWGQAHSLMSKSNRQGYIGYISRKAISEDVSKPTHRVVALRAPIFTRPDIKSFISFDLPMNSLICVQEGWSVDDGDFIRIEDNQYCHKRHIEKSNTHSQDDFVNVAQRFMGVPYIWGGTGRVGVDCSGLLQMALCAAGYEAPRDADMQERDLGRPVMGDLQRGDLIFWPGHVGILSDANTLLHANAYHMETAEEPLSEAIARIGEPRTIKRLT
jgi:cell wall-associated NlpC family hydrolase